MSIDARYLKTKYTDNNNLIAWMPTRGLVFLPKVHYSLSPLEIKWMPSVLSFLRAFILNAFLITIVFMVIFYSTGTPIFEFPETTLVLILTGFHLLADLFSAWFTHYKVLLTKK